MTGLAGIGYGLLRLADPQSVPSVLTLEPPRPPAVPAH
jgi:lantibiotic modifying enzyme